MSYQQNSQAFGQQQQQQQQQQQDVVSAGQYQYALTNFRIAHEKVEQQRKQLEEQERQVAQLRARIALLEGSVNTSISGPHGNSVDDFSIKNSASQLDKLINRWAADVIRSPPVPLGQLCAAILSDLLSGLDITSVEATALQVQCYLRHAMAETISEGVINCLIVTNSMEANIQLTRIHEHIFARDPTVASVWRRQTFSAGVDSCTPDTSLNILYEHVPELMKAQNGKIPAPGGISILDSAYSFSRMLHGSGANQSDAFYRAFVPEIGSSLSPRQIELVKRCLRSERGEADRVGATIFPGLVKVSRPPTGSTEKTVQTVVRRAQVICECAMGGSPISSLQYPSDQAHMMASLQYPNDQAHMMATTPNNTFIMAPSSTSTLVHGMSSPTLVVSPNNTGPGMLSPMPLNTSPVQGMPPAANAQVQPGYM